MGNAAMPTYIKYQSACPKNMHALHWRTPAGVHGILGIVFLWHSNGIVVLLQNASTYHEHITSYLVRIVVLAQ